MKSKYRNRIAFLALASIALIAIAKTWGPWRISDVYPTVQSYADDLSENYVPSGNLPRQLLNVGVQKIKAGDMIRIVYGNGDVYDFEVKLQCSYVLSVSCQYKRAVKKAGIDAAPTMSSKDAQDLREVEKDTCPWDNVRKEYPQYRWEVSYPDSGSSSTVLVDAGWRYVGTIVEMVKGRGGCK